MRKLLTLVFDVSGFTDMETRNLQFEAAVQAEMTKGYPDTTNPGGEQEGHPEAVLITSIITQERGEE